MDRRLRRAPDAEWVLMYRLGLSRQRIAAIVRAEPATVGYHLVIARRQDPGLEAEHLAAAGATPVPYPSPADLAHMDELIAWVKAEGRLPWTVPATEGKGRWRGGCPGAGAKRPRGPWTRPTVTVWPKSPDGWETAGKPRTRPAGTAVWPSSWTSGTRATTGPAIGSVILSGNTPSACGFTPSGTSGAAANWML